MSLVAATAVAGLTSTASAKPMEEAIKNVDLSGYVRYRYTNGKSETESNKYKTVLKISSKVNDNVTAFIKAAGEDGTTNVNGDADPVTTAVKEAKFIVKAGKATVIAGKQGLQTPFADIADQQGTGLVALYPVGPITLAGGWYTNSDAKSIYNTGLNPSPSTENDIGGNNISALAAIGKTGNINYSAWFAQVSETNLNVGGTLHATAQAGATAMNFNVKGQFGPASVELNHASVDYSLNAAAKTLADELNPTQTRIVAGMKAGIVNVAAGFVVTGDEGGNVTLGDTDAKANFVLENTSASELADASIIYVGAKAKVSGVTLGLEYLDGDGKAAALTKAAYAAASKIDVDEMKFSAAYAMSKNFNVSGFITKGEENKVDTDMSRIEIKYTF